LRCLRPSLEPVHLNRPPRAFWRAAIEQRHAESSFEIRQGLADDGLRLPELATGCGETALLRSRDEGAKLVEGYCVERNLSSKTMVNIE
jgi:hypothetical protein